mmetsp:Transcript_10702/g.10580  ORF Transcript_10702/g.10580 Transcript_10702/m.10580 type:complete len:289 (-) Transcript_10702:77-943(-)|eukprot:CAMPEP_0196995558 /NCGR_PEP_ID=MMETSP1380-20130617/1626_1 /TAXON_ID=5936 /ORGANISM="Euplotes crassus, Strain CT5" /LENGTH=288 /DNA_ID=CAMNT_0042411243 /DNA_START=30 /DNA_END=896 /DNA_ORIENTATION=-
MHSPIQNFSNCMPASQNAIYYPTPLRQTGYGIQTSTSPDVCAFEQEYSPLARQQEMKYGYDRIQSQSPVMNLMKCQNTSEVPVYNPNGRKEGNNTPGLKLRLKLNSSSKAFVKKDTSVRNYRKASSDTKAHTEDDGNCSDCSDSSFNSSAPNLVLKKCMTTNISYVPNNDNLVISENAQASLVKKFKTELCKNYLAGDCKFGSKCSFAHGYDELAKRSLPLNYKTKVCKQFHEEMYCSYGERCQFIHIADPVEEENMALTKAIYSSVGLMPAKKSSKGRLSIFKALAN